MKRIMLINLHDVLIDFQYTLYLDILKTYSRFSMILDKPKMMNRKQFSEREEYDVLCIMRKKYSGKNAFEKFGNDMILGAKYLNTFMKNPNFYMNCEPMSLMRHMMKGNFSMIDVNGFDEVVVLIDNFNDIQSKNAYSYCENIFTNSKFRFEIIELEKKKHFIVDELKTFTTYIDHNINNVRYVCEKLKSLESKEILLPRYKFNKMPIDLSLLIHGKNGIFSYFEPL